MFLVLFVPRGTRPMLYLFPLLSRRGRGGLINTLTLPLPSSFIFSNRLSNRLNIPIYHIILKSYNLDVIAGYKPCPYLIILRLFIRLMYFSIEFYTEFYFRAIEI